MKIINEFKEFAVKGNVIDMAVGVIIGGAFGKIVTSLVSDLIMPVIGVVTGSISLSHLKFTLELSGGADSVSVHYGMFLQNVVDFLIVAFCIFLMVKFINSFKKKEAKAEAKAPSKEEALLAEIRDLLKAQSEKDIQ